MAVALTGTDGRVRPKPQPTALRLPTTLRYSRRSPEWIRPPCARTQASSAKACNRKAPRPAPAYRSRVANARAAVSSALQRDEFGLKKEAAGFQARAAQQQQEQLRNVLLDPKSTPEQRAVAQRSLSGKTAADRMQTVALPDTTNEMGQVVRGGQALVRVLEDGTVQQVPIGAAPAPQAMPKPASKAEFDALPKGTRFTDPNGQVRIK